jgi:cell division protein FtsL
MTSSCSVRISFTDGESVVYNMLLLNLLSSIISTVVTNKRAYQTHVM